MNKEYYKKYYHLERKNWWFVVRNHIIMDAIRQRAALRPGLRILNVGAATGGTSELLQEFGEVVSVEYDPDCYAFTKERVDIELIQGSILELPFEDNSFDMVCAFDVIEHVEDDRLAARELMRVCKPKGDLVVTVPCYMSLWSAHDLVNHHFRRYTLPQLTRLFVPPSPIKYRSYFNTLLFPPIMAYRVFSRLLLRPEVTEDTEPDNTLGGEGSLSHKILYGIFSLERKLLKGMRFPFGVSCILMLENAPQKG
jgi:SAM-dependent methyltransferase